MDVPTNSNSLFNVEQPLQPSLTVEQRGYLNRITKLIMQMPISPGNQLNQSAVPSTPSSTATLDPLLNTKNWLQLQRSLSSDSHLQGMLLSLLTMLIDMQAICANSSVVQSMSSDTESAAMQWSRGLMHRHILQYRVWLCTRSLCQNAAIGLEPYLHLLVPLLVSLCTCQHQLPLNPSLHGLYESTLEMRRDAAKILASLCSKFTPFYPNLLPRCCTILSQPLVELASRCQSYFDQRDISQNLSLFQQLSPISLYGALHALNRSLPGDYRLKFSFLHLICSFGTNTFERVVLPFIPLLSWLIGSLFVRETCWTF